METRIDEVADGIYRLSTYIPDQDFMFNQFLIDAEDPLLFHCGLRGLFPLVSEAAARVVSPEARSAAGGIGAGKATNPKQTASCHQVAPVNLRPQLESEVTRCQSSEWSI